MLHAIMGHTALRYQIEVVPLYVEGVPGDAAAVAVVWEKGGKLCLTEPAAVDPASRTAAFHEIMRQVRARCGPVRCLVDRNRAAA
jgi:hypothetical protein